MEQFVECMLQEIPIDQQNMSFPDLLIIMAQKYQQDEVKGQ